MTDPSQNQPPTLPVPPVPPAPPAPPVQPVGTTLTPEQQKYIDELNQLNSWAQSFGAQQHSAGKAAVEKQVAELLGCTLEEAKVLVEAGRVAQDANLSETDKKIRDAERAQADAKKLQDQAHQLIYEALVTDALIQQGMNRAAARSAIPLVNVQGEVTLESVVAAAGNLRVGFPQLFGTAPVGGNGTSVGQPGPADGRQGGPVDTATRGTPPASTGQGQTPRDRATARLRDRRGGRLKSDGPPSTEMDYRRS